MDQFQLMFNLCWKRGNLWLWTAKLIGCFAPRAHSEYIWSFYRHNKNMYTLKIKADQAQKRNNMTSYLLQNTWNLQHICTHSPILTVTLHTVLENGSNVPAGWNLIIHGSEAVIHWSLRTTKTNKMSGVPRDDSDQPGHCCPHEETLGP